MVCTLATVALTSSSLLPRSSVAPAPLIDSDVTVRMCTPPPLVVALVIVTVWFALIESDAVLNQPFSDNRCPSGEPLLVSTTRLSTCPTPPPLIVIGCVGSAYSVGVLVVGTFNQT